MIAVVCYAMEDAGFQRELSDFPLLIDIAVPKKSVALKKYKKKPANKHIKSVVYRKDQPHQKRVAKSSPQRAAKLKKIKKKKKPVKKPVRSKKPVQSKNIKRKKDGKATKSKAVLKRRPTSIARRHGRI